MALPLIDAMRYETRAYIAHIACYCKSNALGIEVEGMNKQSVVLHLLWSGTRQLLRASLSHVTQWIFIKKSAQWHHRQWSDCPFMTTIVALASGLGGRKYSYRKDKSSLLKF